MKTKDTLDMLQSAKLIGYVSEAYTKADCSDEAFAAIATEALGFKVVRRHVTTRRDALKIPPHRGTRASTVRTRRERCERDGAALAAIVADLSKNLSLVIKVLNLQKHFHGTPHE